TMIGDIGVASYGIVANINLIAILIFQGMGQGVQPLISRYRGMDNTSSVITLIKYSVVGVLVVAGLLMLVNLTLSDFIVSLFNKTDHVQMQALAKEGLHYFSIAFLAAGFNIIVIYIMAALGNAMSSMVVSLSRGLILIPIVMMLLSNYFGITGVWSTMLVVESLTLVLSIGFIILFIKK